MLRIPELTLEDNFKLEDFQHDFNHINDMIKTNYINAKDFGISGLEEDDNTDKIQELIAKKGTIYFPKGVYNLSKLISVYSDTTIHLHQEAMFVRKHTTSMFNTATTEETTDYNGESNIKFIGGIYKHNGNMNPSNIFSIFHAENVGFYDVTMLNTIGAHAIDLIGSKNIKIVGCKIKGYYSDDNASKKEAIQIDAAGCNSYPIYTDKNCNAYDGTPTCNVLVRDCFIGASEDFKPFPTAVGQHGQLALKGSRYENIMILNNIFEGDSEANTNAYGIRGISWANSTISGNTIKGYKYSIVFDMWDVVNNTNGDILTSLPDSPPTEANEEMYFLGCRNITITDNKILGAVSTSTRPGIWLNLADSLVNATKEKCVKHKGFTISNNIIVMPSTTVKSFAIESDTSEDITIAGNVFINNAKSDSIAVNVDGYSKNIIIGDNVYKNFTESNYHYSKSTSLNIKRKGKRVLYTGKLFNGRIQQDGSNAEAGQMATLSDNISNYDYLLVYIYNSGGICMTVDFTTNNTQCLRTLNLTDSPTSTTYSLTEMNIAKRSETTIELNSNKFQNMSTSTPSVTMNSDNQYIGTIIGFNA